jgi:hypothetical protein
MTHDEKIRFMRIAASMCDFGFKDEQLDLLVSIYESVIRNEGKTTIMDVARIMSQVQDRANLKARSAALDKFSTNLSE